MEKHQVAYTVSAQLQISIYNVYADARFLFNFTSDGNSSKNTNKQQLILDTSVLIVP